MVAIDGGIVTANGGSNAAGIGGGNNCNGGTVTIDGGSVTANGEGWASGIGGGAFRNGATVAVNGGTVIAIGGSGYGSTSAPGIGGGLYTSTATKPGTLGLGTGMALYGGADSDSAELYATGSASDIETRYKFMRIEANSTLSVPYLRWRENEGIVADNCTSFTLVNENTTEFADNTWYVVSESVTINSRITVSGEAHLILCDGKTLTAREGITVNFADNEPEDGESDNVLNIYAQEGGTGRLYAGCQPNGNGLTVSCAADSAGIGGGNYGSCGAVRIHGGTVTANGAGEAAGIGGGGKGIYVAGNNKLNIYAQNDGTNVGALVARGDGSQGVWSAGIGGREPEYGDSESNSRDGGTINIHGGTVIATGGRLAAGIGGGYGNDGGTINIYGGTVKATGGEKAADIGGGGAIGNGGTIAVYGGTVEAVGGQDAAGIGGGSKGVGGTVTIHGGTVKATGNKGATGIGGGTQGAGATVVINSGTVITAGGQDGVGISAGAAGTYNGHLTLGASLALYGGNEPNPTTLAEKDVIRSVTYYASSRYMTAIDAVEGFKNAVDKLPAADAVTTADKEAIENARAAYDDMTAEQKAKVDSSALKKLEDAEKALAAAEKAEKEAAEKEAADDEGEGKSDPAPTPDPDPTPDQGGEMRRLYNPYSYEHFYTSDDDEQANLVSLGWVDEGQGWVLPEKSDIPVYRLYNPYNGGDHHYTKSADERDALVAAGWQDEGVGWYSADEGGTPVYREYNPFEVVRNHNYTTDAAEHDGLVALGWHDEGIAWYGA